MIETCDPALPGIESLVLRGAQRGGSFKAIDTGEGGMALPPDPDRVSCYPNTPASREALDCVGMLYTRLGDAIRGNGRGEPNFARAVHVQRINADFGSTIAVTSPSVPAGA